MQLVEAVTDLEAAGASVGVVKVNAEEATELKHQYGIRGYPSLKVFKKGQMAQDYTVRDYSPSVTFSTPTCAILAFCLRASLVGKAVGRWGAGNWQGPRDAAHIGNWLFKATQPTLIDIVRATAAEL